MSLAPGARLGPYEVLAPLGSGGMGEVYRARDPRLDREVAIKVLPAELADDRERLKRFEKEARSASSLNHPSIVTIYEIGRAESVSYIAMELIDGRTLRELLFAGPLPARRLLQIAAQIADGLARAHEAGVVHRDLKPENVMVTKDGLAKILDFGLAKLSKTASGSGEASQLPTESGTSPGVLLGTVGYMSPEQAAGQPIDFRSDQFSFGSILYEMTTGKRAFRGKTGVDTLSAILNDEPEPIDIANPRASSPLRWLVERCLAKDPDARYASTRDLARELASVRDHLSEPVRAGPESPRRARRIAIAAGIVVALVAGAGVLLLRRTGKGGDAAGGIKRIAVLPFDNLGVPEDDYFADGIADAVRGKLTSLPGVEVIARGSSVGYKKTPKTPRQIADELDVGYLLVATVRWQKSGGANRVQVNPELVQVKKSGAPASKWQQPFEASLTDVFQVQSEIATRVARELGVALGAVEEKRLSEKPTQNLAAYDAFLRGEEAFKMQDKEQEGLAFYEQAVAIDPAFWRAWVGVSLASSFVYGTEKQTEELARRAGDAALRAAGLAPDTAESHLALGTYRWLVLRRYNDALEELEKGQRLAPRDADLLVARGAIETNLGLWSEAVAHYREAERLDPRSPDPKLYLGTALLVLRRYSEAYQILERGVAVAPRHISMVGTKAQWFLTQGDLVGARNALRMLAGDMEPTRLAAFTADFVGPWVLDEDQRELLVRLTPQAFDRDRGRWGLCLAEVSFLRRDRSGTREFAEEARKDIEERVRAAQQDPFTHSRLGLAFAYLNRRDDAVREGDLARTLVPAQGGLVDLAVQGFCARIYTILGDEARALDSLETLLKKPGLLTPARLKIDPNFDSLRKNARFQGLVAAAK